MQKFGDQIDQAVSKTPPAQPYTGPQPQPLGKSSQAIIDHLEDYKERFRVNGSDVDPDAVAKASQLQGIIREMGPDVSYKDLNRVRQIWDQKVARAGGYSGQTMAEGSMLDAQKAGATAIRSELAKANPDIAAINTQFHFWKNVSDVLDATETRKTGQFGGLGRLFAPLLGFTGGVAHGGYAQGAEVAAGLLALNQAIQSTAWRTTSAVVKNQIADAMMSGNFKRVSSLAARVATAQAVAVQAPTASAPDSRNSFPNAAR